MTPKPFITALPSMIIFLHHSISGARHSWAVEGAIAPDNGRPTTTSSARETEMNGPWRSRPANVALVLSGGCHTQISASSD